MSKTAYVIRVYISSFRMHFHHFIAFSKYLRWFIYVYENQMQLLPICGKRMSKQDVATRLKRGFQVKVYFCNNNKKITFYVVSHCQRCTHPRFVTVLAAFDL